MSHETYLTTRDKIERLTQPQSTGMKLLWTGATVALAAAAIASSGIAMLGFGLATAYTGFKTYEGFSAKPHSHEVEMTSRSTNDDLRDLDIVLQQQRLAGAPQAVPQLVDETSSKEWRSQLAEKAREDAVRHANRSV